MDKRFSIEIDGRKVPMRVNKFALTVYRVTFKKDLGKTLAYYCNLDNLKMDAKTFGQVAQIVWAFAKTADPRIPKFSKWVKRFKVFPVREIIVEITEKINEQRK